MATWVVKLDNGPQRVNHAAVAIKNRIFSFGGFCCRENYTSFRPIEIHILNALTLRWGYMQTHHMQVPEVPFQRYGHSVVAYKKKAYLWGGRNDINACNVLYIFDVKELAWEQPTTSGLAPLPRDGHAAAVVDNYMYIFGGYIEELQMYSQELYRINLETMHWEFVITQGQIPSCRDFLTLTTIGNNIYVFGGRGDKNGSVDTRNEVYCNQISYLDTVKMEWITPQTKGNIPIGRRSHSAFVFEDHLYIFGGYNSQNNTHYNDLHCYIPNTKEWLKIKTYGIPGPCPRRRQCACTIGSSVYLFGGTSPDTNFTDISNILELELKDHVDLYVLDLSPSLKTLSILSVIKHKLDYSILPQEIQFDIKILTRPSRRGHTYS
ncbi:KLHDC3 [Cordylochernes scorpioides]|uniref:KLHDC3 n=1 Tax=Cordylochernes scorpioides TaxID=51811 RepID=A0ABY6L4K5_9ARAC|nr:KLHDC3 [Cordylochernes scorpioides]